MQHDYAYYNCLPARLCKSNGTILGVLDDTTSTFEQEVEVVEEKP